MYPPDAEESRSRRCGRISRARKRDTPTKYFVTLATTVVSPLDGRQKMDLRGKTAACTTSSHSWIFLRKDEARRFCKPMPAATLQSTHSISCSQNEQLKLSSYRLRVLSIQRGNLAAVIQFLQPILVCSAEHWFLTTSNEIQSVAEE